MAPHIEIRHLSVRYGAVEALRDVSLSIARHELFAIIGPANAGKTTLLKCLNRTVELRDRPAISGEVRIDGEDVFSMGDVCGLRQRVGMVAPLPVGLPISIYDNVAYAPRLGGVRSRRVLDGRVEACLRQVALWDEVKDRLHELGTRLSGGQQQRLALARALSHEPEILCLNKFSIAIDPVTTMRIEDVLLDLKQQMTIVLVTNLLQQAHRLADTVAFLNHGAVIECGPVERLFSEHPEQEMTARYVSGAFG